MGEAWYAWGGHNGVAILGVRPMKTKLQVKSVLTDGCDLAIEGGWDEQQVDAVRLGMLHVLDYVYGCDSHTVDATPIADD